MPTQIAETKTPPENITPVDPLMVTQNTDGFVWREFLVRLPRDLTLDSLKEPSIWRRVQLNHRVSLRQFDRLTILDFAESWLAQAIVVAATSVGVTLSKPSVIQLDPRTEQLAEDELYRILWTGGGYVVSRKADGMAMTLPVVNRAQALRDLGTMYPKTAA